VLQQSQLSWHSDILENNIAWTAATPATILAKSLQVCRRMLALHLGVTVLIKLAISAANRGNIIELRFRNPQKTNAV
jgi:hypothetical protein